MDKDTEEIIAELKDILLEIEGNKIGIRKFIRSKEVVGSVPTRSLELSYIKMKKR